MLHGAPLDIIKRTAGQILQKWLKGIYCDMLTLTERGRSSVVLYVHWEWNKNQTAIRKIEVSY